jgi:hypothetical protein
MAIGLVPSAGLEALVGITTGLVFVKDIPIIPARAAAMA